VECIDQLESNRHRAAMSVARTAVRAMLAAVLVGWPALAGAHSQLGSSTGFATGFLHPLTGIDHVLAMLAVGMWGAQLRGDAIWVLPVAFPLVMALGAVAGIAGLPMLPVEPGIAVSVIALGAAIASDFRPPLIGAAALVSVFAIFHGYAHGVELPRRSDALPYCAGFVLATGLIHLSGIGIGLVTRWPHGRAALRAAGAAIAAAGLVLAARLVLA
jgi:urease accessory protein